MMSRLQVTTDGKKVTARKTQNQRFSRNDTEMLDVTVINTHFDQRQK